jgi:3-isopropylmalate/(R)-2-methylmalate dehydratase large subunit
VKALDLRPRFLFLSADPALVVAQLEGRAVSLDAAAPLRDDVSTDEITPLPVMVHFDATLGRYAHTGFKAGDELPIARDALRNLGINVIVAGKRYGKGSSREHSVVAERAAGIRLVIAESFERIYRQNADNVGLLTSTDLGLVNRLLRGEAIDLDELLNGRDALAAAIVRAGGLLAYGRSSVRAEPVEAQPFLRQAQDDRESGLRANGGKASTLFEKIVHRHTLGAPLQSGEGGFVRADLRFIHEYYTGMAAHLLGEAFGDDMTLHEPETIVAFEDHLSYVHRSPVHVSQGLVGGVQGLSRAHRAFVDKHQLTHHGYLQALEAGDEGNTGSQGISHALVAERYALPGQLIVGTDSHTPHSGAVGCVAFGVGTTDMAHAFVTGAVRFTMPEELRIECRGLLPPGVSAKDLVLHLLALPALKSGAGVGRVFEFGGSAIRALGTDERATLTNMTAELGGFTGIVEPDDETVRYLRERRGIAFTLEPWMKSDPDAGYVATIDVDCTTLSPMVARPGDPGRGVPHAVLAWAAARGLRVPAHVTLYLQFGTTAVRDYCTARGYLSTFEAVGAELLQPACGACANCGPGSSTAAEQVTVSAINRNFPGRSGPGSVWLASPATVAASAIAGRLQSFAELQEQGKS